MRGKQHSPGSYLPLFSVPLQTVADIERGWILASKEQHRQLKSLQEKVSKKEVGHGLGYVWLVVITVCLAMVGDSQSTNPGGT